MLLLPDGLESFFSGHSTRNFLTSVAAVVGFSRDERAYLGRWSMGMVSSEEYVRTARQVIFKIQRAVNRCLVEGLDEPYHEDEAIQKLCDAAESTGANPNRIRKRHAVMGNWSGRHSLGGIFPTLEVAEGNWPNVMDDAEGDVGLPEKVALLAQKETLAQSEGSKYDVTLLEKDERLISPNKNL